MRRGGEKEVPNEGKTSNNEHPTPNTQWWRGRTAIGHWMLVVRCSMLDVIFFHQRLSVGIWRNQRGGYSRSFSSAARDQRKSARALQRRNRKAARGKIERRRDAA